MGPQASKMSPRASKITQNHENLVTQNQENPRKKTSRNGTVAGYARSALDTRDWFIKAPCLIKTPVEINRPQHVEINSLTLGPWPRAWELRGRGIYADRPGLIFGPIQCAARITRHRAIS